MTSSIFVEGSSTDNTWDTICELKAKYETVRNIRAVRQDGKGKGDAVRKGFALADREILMILGRGPNSAARGITALLQRIDLG